MPLNQFLINDLNPFDIKSKIGELQTAFNQLTYSHIPIKKKGVFIGCLSKNDVCCFDANQPISEFLNAIEHFHVSNNSLWLDILDNFARNDSNMMPVLDPNNNYLVTC